MYRVSWEKHEWIDHELVVEGDVVDFLDIEYARILFVGLQKHFLGKGYKPYGSEYGISFYVKNKKGSSEKAYVQMEEVKFDK